MVPAGYTGDGVQRRLPRGGASDQDASKAGLLALSAAGNTAARQEAEARQRAQRDLERAMQWVFWVLAIVAYGSLAFTVIALIAGSDRGEDLSLRMQHGNNGWLAIIGLVAGIAAWLVAQRLPSR